jgi:Zn-dependent protease with chaperone function
MTSYRYPNERIILTLTLFFVIVVIAVTAVATFCGSVLFVLAMLLISYLLTRSHHKSLIETAYPVTLQTQPELAHLVEVCEKRLQSGSFKTFIAPGNSLNAYTFGLVKPYGVVVYAGLVRIMDADELRFIIGHELGHMCLGHTWLNSLVGGMAGIPSPHMAAAIMYFAFRWWNRACEYSADRAGMLACGKPKKAATALIKIAAARSGVGLEEALRIIDAEDDYLGNNLIEMISTHPMTIRRLDAIREYAATPEYRRLQMRINQAHPIR